MQSNFTKFLMHVAYVGGSVLLAQHHIVLYASGFVDDIMFSHNGHCDATCVFFSKQQEHNCQNYCIDSNQILLNEEVN